MVGMSIIGNISFGIDFVAGKNRVPSPAAGITALRIISFGFRRSAIGFRQMAFAGCLS
jgi:hypothetical protein